MMMDFDVCGEADSPPPAGGLSKSREESLGSILGRAFLCEYQMLFETIA